MKLETINGIRVITPETDMWLCNEEQRVISDKVYLGVNANKTMWKDITEEEKTKLEILWNNDGKEIIENGSKEVEYEKIIDILTGQAGEE